MKDNYYEVFVIGNDSSRGDYNAVELAYTKTDAQNKLRNKKLHLCGKRPRKFKGIYAHDFETPLIYFEIVRVSNGRSEEDAVFTSDWYYVLNK